MSFPRARTPAERVAYVAGFAAGWKQAIDEFGSEFYYDAGKRLDEVLDLMSEVENELRRAATLPGVQP